ncbi:MAG TPA: fibronectin type III domain-containing protein, partial [bacterium]|nr:fibronectin type III domain-containing protein [bacterium]
GLINGQTYYFAISAVLQLDQSSYAETPLSSEVSKAPLDQQAPAIPGGLECSASKNSFTLGWKRNNDDTIKYEIGYRDNENNNNGRTIHVNQPDSDQTIKTTVDGIIDARNIVVEIRAIDISGNVSLAASKACEN